MFTVFFWPIRYYFNELKPQYKSKNVHFKFKSSLECSSYLGSNDNKALFHFNL